MRNARGVNERFVNAYDAEIEDIVDMDTKDMRHEYRKTIELDAADGEENF